MVHGGGISLYQAEFGYGIDGSERREVDAASLMELPSGVSPVVARRFGQGSGRSYPREGSASLGLGYGFEDSEEVRNTVSGVLLQLPNKWNRCHFWDIAWIGVPRLRREADDGPANFRQRASSLF